MKNILITMPILFLLTGCPGGGRAPHPRSTFINAEHLCFSVDKKDVLDYYTIESSKGNGYSIIQAKEGLHLSYPDNCVVVKWEYGYSYGVNYGLNGNRYVHQFFIDNNGQITNLGGL